MKYVFIIATICFLIFMPKRDVQVRVVDVQAEEKQGSKEQKFSNPDVVNKPVIDERTEKRTVTSSIEIESQIRAFFGDSSEIAIAVFKAESGLRPDAQGWNCHYYREDGGRYSAACKPEDRHMAWSVDCGVTQINVLGRVCPQEYFDPAWNIQKAYEWKYLTRDKTFGAWVAYTSESYKKFIK